MAPRELFTLAMTSEVRLWSMTKAIESGAASTVNSDSGSRVSFSYTLKSRKVRPATSFPFESLTLTGTSTKFTFRTNRVSAAMPSPAAGISGGVAWISSLPWVEGAWLLAGACCWFGVAEDELGAAGSFATPLPGVIGVPSMPVKGGGAWGAGASGTVDGCCWARAARLELRSAASAIATKPSFTGIPSSLNAASCRCQLSVKTDPRFPIPE